jgi:histone-lysine N-methyltransferase SETMAR
VAAIREYILRDRRESGEHAADKFAISYGTAQGIMTDKLGMRRVLARWVPRLLTSEQMGLRVKMCQLYDWRYREEGDYFPNRLITCDETWIPFFLTGKQTSEFCLEASFLAFPYKSDNF